MRIGIQKKPSNVAVLLKIDHFFLRYIDKLEVHIVLYLNGLFLESISIKCPPTKNAFLQFSMHFQNKLIFLSGLLFRCSLGNRLFFIV